MTAATVAAREAYADAAMRLSDSRKAAAERLDEEVAAELAPLKLDKARLITRIETVGVYDGGPHGIDRVAFWVRTNPGTEPGPLMKVASGGELARIILALKVVLAARGSAPTLVFDEVDAGVGGATAAAVGERLARLGAKVQVLAVTHAPQVAALANEHMLIAKEAVHGPHGETMTTRVSRARRRAPARGDRPHACRPDHHRRGPRRGRAVDVAIGMSHIDRHEQSEG